MLGKQRKEGDLKNAPRCICTWLIVIFLSVKQIFIESLLMCQVVGSNA